MPVKTVTYKRLIGNKWVAQTLRGEDMDKHIEAMLAEGWQILDSGSTPGDGRTFGPRVKHDKRTITYHKP